MAKRTRWTLLIGSVLLLTACQTLHPEKEKQPADLTWQALSSLDSFWVKRLDIDYAADCRIRIKTPTLDENGSCRIIITRNNRFHIRIHSSLAGNVLTAYQDDAQIRVVNYHDRSALVMSNNAQNRQKALEFINLSAAEFRSIFWGREIKSDKTDLLFAYKEGRPATIRKSHQRQHQTVKIRKWMQYKGAWIPKTLEFEDSSRGIYLKVVITTFNPDDSTQLTPLAIPAGFNMIQ